MHKSSSLHSLFVKTVSARCRSHSLALSLGTHHTIHYYYYYTTTTACTPNKNIIYFIVLRVTVCVMCMCVGLSAILLHHWPIARAREKDIYFIVVN